MKKSFDSFDNRLKKIEKRLSQNKKKIGFPCDLNLADLEELIEKEKRGEEIDWDIYDFTKCGELPEETIHELYERAKRD